MANHRRTTSHRGHNEAHDDAPPASPSPLVAPAQPMSTAVLKILKNTYHNWVTAGGAPIYGPTPPAVPPTITPL